MSEDIIQGGNTCAGENCPEMLKMKGKLGSISTLQKYILAFFIGTFAFQYMTLAKLTTFIQDHTVEESVVARDTDEIKRTADTAFSLIQNHLDQNLADKCKESIRALDKRVTKLEYDSGAAKP